MVIDVNKSIKFRVTIRFNIVSVVLVMERVQLQSLMHGRLAVGIYCASGKPPGKINSHINFFTQISVGVTFFFTVDVLNVHVILWRTRAEIRYLSPVRPDSAPDQGWQPEVPVVVDRVGHRHQLVRHYCAVIIIIVVIYIAVIVSLGMVMEILLRLAHTFVQASILWLHVGWRLEQLRLVCIIFALFHEFLEASDFQL